MLNEQVIEKVVERLVRRIEQGNEYVITTIAKNIKKLGKLSTTDAHKLAQIMKYGGDYNKIVDRLNKITKINKKEIYKIFDEVAKRDYDFAEDFYKYRNKKYISYYQNEVLQKQVKAIADITSNRYENIMNTKQIGLGIVDKDNNITFKTLKTAYNELIDEAVLNVSQGKETFKNAMFKRVKELGNGLKVIYEQVDEETGEIKRSVRRADSVVRMHLNDSLNELHNATQTIIGNQFESDGVEISVHEFPAIDHELAQGRQFSNEQFKKLQEEGKATDYKDVKIDLHRTLKDGSTSKSFRPISHYNCYHYVFSIILGVNIPQYDDKKLQQIIDRNNEGFTLDGKHYTMYEGTQLQRKIESAIRNQKDIQIAGRESGLDDLVQDAQRKITLLNNKYKQVSEASGLSRKMDRLRVSGYHRVKRQDNYVPKSVVDLKYNALDDKEMSFTEWQEHFNKKYGSFDMLDGKTEYKPGKLGYVGIDNSFGKIDKRLINTNLTQYEYLVDKYNLIDEHGLTLKAEYNNGRKMAWSQRESAITFNMRYFKDKDMIDETLLRCRDRKWFNTTDKDKIDKHIITHEYGHLVEEHYINNYNKDKPINNGYLTRREADSMIRDEILSRVVKKTGLTRTEIKNNYFSGYAKSRRNFEWFAEAFTDYELENTSPFAEEFGKWLEENVL